MNTATTETSTAFSVNKAMSRRLFSDKLFWQSVRVTATYVVVVVPLWLFVVLVAFVVGVVIGLLAWLPTVVRQRREMGKLRRSQPVPVPAPAPATAPTPAAALPGSADSAPRDAHGV